MIKICDISVKYRHYVKIEEIKYGEIYGEDNLKVRHPRCVFKSNVRYMYTSNTTMSNTLSIY
jgi:hypothetical protein